MLKKSRIIKMAAAVFCIGVLIGGIGTGVAIAEYTSLEYTGEHILGEEHIKTENIDVAVVPEEGKKIQVCRNHWINGIHYGEEIPMNTIRYVVTYNTELVNLWAAYEEYEIETNQDAGNRDDDDWEKDQGCVKLEWDYIGNDFELLMRNKDKILNELKNGKVGFYRTKSISSIQIWVNPEMKTFIEFS